MKHDDHKWDADERESLEPLRDELEALRRRHASDPSLPLLRAAKASVLPDDLQGAVLAHLDKSAWSKSLLDGAEAIEAPLAGGARERVLARVRKEGKGAAQPRSFWSAIWRPALATVAIAALTVVIVAPRMRQVVAPPVTVTMPAPAQAPPILLALDKPDVKLPADVLVQRSGSGGSEQYLKDLAPAFDAYRADRFTDAASLFDGLAAKYPKSREVFFYLGVSLLHQKDAARATTALRKARTLDNGERGAQISWYLAVALQRAGQMEAAQGELTNLCKGRSEFAQKACAAVK